MGTLHRNSIHDHCMCVVCVRACPCRVRIYLYTSCMGVSYDVPNLFDLLIINNIQIMA